MRTTATIAAVSGLGLGLLAGGCGSAAPPRVSSCGIPYVFHVGDRAIDVGSCADTLPTTATAITTHVGERFSVRILGDPGGKLAFPAPAPDSGAVRVVSRQGATVVYRASTSGTAVLLARGTIFCMASNGNGPTPTPSTCPTLTVRVLP